MSEANTHRRLVVIGVLVLALFAGLLTRLWFLQVNGGETLAVAAQRQRDHFVNVPAVRGTIYDNAGNILAETLPVTSLVVDRQELSSSERTTLEKNLGAILFKSPEDVAKLIDNPNYQNFESVPVASKISNEQAVYVLEHRDEFPEVSVTTTEERVYPHGTAAADVLGYLGRVNQDDLDAHQGEGYQAIDSIGKTGIEKMFESELRGTPGKKKIEVDNENRAVNVVEVKKPAAGHDVHLTVNLPTQQIAEESLQQGMDGARGLVDNQTGYFVANAGAVVVLDARTGAVVSMASNPGFDPNEFIAGKGDQYINDPNNPLLNRALNPSPPGSTFKTFTSIAMLQSGLYADGANHVNSENPPGCFTFGNENDTPRCNAGKTVLGPRSLVSALTVSSDVYFYQVGNEFWNRYRNEGQDATGNHNDDVAGDKIPDAQHPVGSAIQHVADDYGFGELTGVGLESVLSKGVIPDHDYRVKLNPGNAEAQFWRRGDSASLAVGQGDVLVTPLQLANAYATFANNGTLYQPRLVSDVTQSGQPDKVVSTIAPIVKRSMPLSPDVRGPIEEGLHGVVYDQDGTAAGAFADYMGPPLIGKTGTAERRPNQDTSWFAAITNPDNDPALPQYVVVAMVEQGGFGAAVAAPIVRRVIDFLNNPQQTPAPVVVAPAVGTEVSN